jgi:hypothetical protein
MSWGRTAVGSLMAAATPPRPPPKMSPSRVPRPWRWMWIPRTLPQPTWPPTGRRRRTPLPPTQSSRRPARPIRTASPWMTWTAATGPCAAGRSPRSASPTPPRSSAAPRMRTRPAGSTPATPPRGAAPCCPATTAAPATTATAAAATTAAPWAPVWGYPVRPSTWSATRTPAWPAPQSAPGGPAATMAAAAPAAPATLARPVPQASVCASPTARAGFAVTTAVGVAAGPAWGP